MRNSPVSRTEFDLIRRELDDLKRRVRIRENDHSPTVPVYRPDFPDDAIQGQVALADNSTSVLALFWRVVSGWIGPLLSFSFANVGDWLSVETTTAGAPFGAGVIFSVGAGDFDVIALAGQIYLDGSATSIFSEDFDMIIDSHESITIFSRGAGANVWDITGPLDLLCGDNFDINLVAGKSVTVHDHLGNDIFKVDENGGYHIKTGATWVADL